MAVAVFSDKAMHDWDNIKFITHLLSSDSVILFHQDVFLCIEFKLKIPLNRSWAWGFLSSFHSALIVSEKIKRREIKGVVKHTLHLIVTPVSKEARKDGGQMFRALDADKKQKFHIPVEWLWCAVELRSWLANFMVKYVTRLSTTNVKSCDLLDSNGPSSTPSPAKVTLTPELSFFNTKHFWFAANQMRCSGTLRIKGILLKPLEFSCEKGAIENWKKHQQNFRILFPTRQTAIGWSPSLK